MSLWVGVIDKKDKIVVRKNFLILSSYALGKTGAKCDFESITWFLLFSFRKKSVVRIYTLFLYLAK